MEPDAEELKDTASCERTGYHGLDSPREGSVSSSSAQIMPDLHRDERDLGERCICGPDSTKPVVVESE